MPISTTSTSVSAPARSTRQRHAQLVVPVALGRRRRASTIAAPQSRKSLVVVLPVEPVTPTTAQVQTRAVIGREVLERPGAVVHANRRRPLADRRAAERRRARRPRATTISTRAPADIASVRKSCPSTRSPGERDEHAAGRDLARVDRDVVAHDIGRAEEQRRRPWPRAIVSTVAVSIDACSSSPRDLAVVEVDRAVGEDLVVLVSLAGDQHGVAGLGERDRTRDRRARGRPRPATMRPRVAQAVLDLQDDPDGILGARIVARHDDAVRRDSRGRAHERPLVGIPVAAAAEHDDHPPVVTAFTARMAFSSESGVCA